MRERQVVVAHVLVVAYPQMDPLAAGDVGALAVVRDGLLDIAPLQGDDFQSLLPLLPGDRTPVAFQFTPLLGDWQIDDVYVDPRRFS